MATDEFLATTSLDTHWDRSGKQVFLGPWCLRYTGVKVADGDYTLLDGYLSSDERMLAARQWSKSLLEPTIVAFGNLLNDVHGFRHSARYWRTILAPWLLDGLLYYHFRVEQLKVALSAYPRLRTAGLPATQFVQPLDWLEFTATSLSDGFNLQTYTRLCHYFGIAVEERPVENVAALFGSRRAGKPAGLRYKQLLWTVMTAGGKSHGIVGCDSYFKRSDELALAVRSGFSYTPDWTGYQLPVLPPIDLSLRSGLIEAARPTLQGLDEPIRDMLLNEMPVAYLEGYQAVRSHALNHFPASAGGAFSSNAWWYHEMFKFWAAERAEKSSAFAMLGCQHGGNYGSALEDSLPSEQLEIELSDRYFTWGWKGSSGKAEPMPAPKLAGRSVVRNAQATDILLVSAFATRYEGSHSLSMYSPLRFEEYLARQRRFYEALPEPIRALLRVRLYHDDGWDISERWHDWSNGAARIERVSDRDFLESLGDARLNVCDYQSTPVIESLCFNVPTVLHWSPEHVELRDAVVPYYERLAAAGILHHSPEAAAAHIAAIYQDVASWWDSDAVQEARSEFCRYLAATSPQYLRQWARVFKYGKSGTQHAAAD